MQRRLLGSAGASGAVLLGGRLVFLPQQDEAHKALKRDITVDWRTASADEEESGRVKERMLQLPPPEAAAEALRRRGFSILHGVLAEAQLGRETQQGIAQASRLVDAGAVGALVGTMAATLLPTVHNNDAYFRQALGAQMGERAAAHAFAALPEPSLLGCSQAAAKLSALASRHWHGAAPALPPMRALTLAEGESDEDGISEEDSFDVLARTLAHARETMQAAADTLRGDGDGDGDGDSVVRYTDAAGGEVHEGGGRAGEAMLAGVSPGSAVLRAWNAVLLTAAAQWTSILDAVCAREHRVLRRHSVTLLVPERPEEEEGGQLLGTGAGASHLPPWAEQGVSWIRRAASWPREGPIEGLSVLLPLPPPADSNASPPVAWARGGGLQELEQRQPEEEEPCLVVELLLPGMPWESSTPAVRIELTAGSALVIDGRTRWRMVKDVAQAGGGCCCVVYEYRPAAALGVAGLPFRMAEAAAVSTRAAFALALGPPHSLRIDSAGGDSRLD